MQIEVVDVLKKLTQLECECKSLLKDVRKLNKSMVKLDTSMKKLKSKIDGPGKLAAGLQLKIANA